MNRLKKYGAGRETIIVNAARDCIKNLQKTFLNNEAIYEEMIQYNIIEPREGSREEFEKTIAEYRNDLSKELMEYTKVLHDNSINLSEAAQTELQDIELERKTLMQRKN